VTLLGVNLGERFGAALAPADLDGDGKSDLIAGVEPGDGPDDRRQDGRKVYVVRGSTTLPAALHIARRAFVLGQRSSDMLGTSLAAVDWDGDGRLDLSVSAPFADGPGDRSDCSAAYVIRGMSLLK